MPAVGSPVVPFSEEPTFAAPIVGTVGDTATTRPAAGDRLPKGADGVTITRPTANDQPTMAVGGDSATRTGPTVAGWPFDETDMDLPGDLVWHSDDPHPDFVNRGLREPTHSPGYYISLGAAVVLVVGLVAAIAVLTVVRPSRDVAGSAVAAQGPPAIEPSEPSDPPASTTTATKPSQSGDNPGEHPLSTSTAAMAQSTCELPRFDPADAAQATFYEATKVCADTAWRQLLQASGLPEAKVTVTTVIGNPIQSQCGGEIAPGDPATQCQGTVYMTPAHLRDGEGNGRFPGRYFGVFLREYAEAVQYQTGLAELTDDEERLAQQATCLAGITSGALAGRGAVDTNITNEIRDRLTTVDAPPDAGTWLAKGFTDRQPAACNVWAD